MQTKISFVWSVFIIIIVGTIFSVIIIFYPIFSLPDTAVKPIIVPKQAIAELPVHLVIPKIHVDAFVEYLGLTPEGAMAVPVGPNDVAWFDLGPRPGEIGSAVIAGHEGWKDNIPAVFDNLSALRAGDIIYVLDAEGATSTFVVRNTELYGEIQNASDVFTSSDGGAHLNLITCEGIWNAVTKSYSDRLVVFADKE